MRKMPFGEQFATMIAIYLVIFIQKHIAVAKQIGFRFKNI
jgi:hypothetical protein